MKLQAHTSQVLMPPLTSTADATILQEEMPTESPLWATKAGHKCHCRAAMLAGHCTDQL